MGEMSKVDTKVSEFMKKAKSIKELIKASNEVSYHGLHEFSKEKSDKLHARANELVNQVEKIREELASFSLAEWDVLTSAMKEEIYDIGTCPLCGGGLIRRVCEGQPTEIECCNCRHVFRST